MKKKKSQKKLWGGRFRKELDRAAKDFSYSLAVDKELFSYDIKTSIAHVKTLARAKILKVGEVKRLIRGLQWVEKHLRGKDLSKFYKDTEDIHTLIQNTLEKKIGVLAGKLHTARSRNDQVITSTKLYLKDKISVVIGKITNYQKALLSLAKKGEGIAIPGYTHLQHAQIVLFAHHLLAYVAMAQRDKERLQDTLKRIDELPLGAGALAGLSFPIDRMYTAKILGFSKVSDNSLDAVSSRDYIVETLSHIAVLFMHFSRLSEDFILWSSQEFGFVEIPDEFATGSSIMPHKKNADLLELIRGRAGKAFGNLVSLLVTMKGLPSAYNRDMQEDKEPLFSSIKLASDALDILSKMVPQIGINKNRCMIASSNSYLYATDLMDHLVKQGVSLGDAHSLVGQIVLYALEKGKDLSKVSLKELKKFSNFFDIELSRFLKPEQSLAKRKTYGSTNPRMVKKMIQKWQMRLRKK
ncbi:MAG: argininosuccinate lyase [Candidatus Omnitrophota bacterium]